MKQLIKTFRYISVLILTLSFIGCEDDDAVLPVVEAGFTYTLSLDTGTVTFINISENGNNYEWDFGDGNMSTEINPINTYANGTYTIILKAKNVSGAYDTFESEIVILIPEILAFPITFDNENVNYGATAFNGAAFQIVDNPAPGGTNNVASKVGEIINSGAAFEGVAFELEEDLDLSTDKSVKMNFWSDAAVDVLLKLEITETDATEFVVSHTGSGWEELVFNFDVSKSYPKIVIFVDGSGTTAGTFYFDDLIQVESPPLACQPETMQSLSAADFNLTFMADPSASITEDNTTLEYIDNPDALTDANESCKAGKITNSNQNPWDNMQIDLAEKITFTDGSSFTMKVYAPQSGYKVTIKLEDKTSNGATFKQVASESTTKTNEWEELTFVFEAGDSNKYDKIVLFFDLESQNGNTYYFDDLKLNAGSGGGGSGGGTTTGENLLTNGDFEGGQINWIGNAFNVDEAGGNSFNIANVATAGAAFNVNLSQIIEILAGKTYTLSFDASSDGTRTMLAGIGLNEAPWSNNTELVNLTSTTQTFTYELKAIDKETSADFGGANSRVLFDMGADTGVVVIDNVVLTCSDCDGGSGGGTGTSGDELIVNGNFETTPITDNGWLFFPNGGTVELSTTVNNGGSNAVKFLAPESGGAPVLKQESFAKNQVSPGDVVTVSFDLKADVTQPGAVINVALFTEKTSGADRAAITIPATNNTWQTVTQDITVTNNLDVSRGLSLELQAACGAVAGCNIEMYVDNISVKIK